MILCEFIINFIKNKRVKRVYWLSSKYNEKLFIEAEKSWLEIIQNIHENNSVFFASWDYESTSNINYVFVTKWPWVTNLITAAACSYIDNIPVIIISVNNQSYNYWLGTHHDSSTSTNDGIDIVGLMKGVTAYSILLIDPNSINETLNKAYNIALNTKKPVHISIPEDFLTRNIDNINFNKSLLETKKMDLSLDELSDIKESISKSKYPLIILWNWIERKSFLDFIKKYNLFYTTLISNNNLIIDSKYYIWNLDLVNSEYISNIIKKSDLVLIINSNFNKFTMSWYFQELKLKKIIHISSNSNDISNLSISNYSFINWNSNALFKNIDSSIKPKWDKEKKLIDKLYIYYKKTFLIKYSKDKYFDFFNVINNCLAKWDILYISVGWLHKYAWMLLRLKDWVKAFFPWAFFSLWTSMRAGWYCLTTNNRVFLLIWDWDFIMNWVDSFILNNKKISLNIILYNNNWYKSLNDESYNEFWTKLNFKKISEWLWLNYYYSDSPSSLEKQIKKVKKVWVNLIEYNVM